jgi:hypothetical protein
MTTLRDLNACKMESRLGSTIQKEWDKNPKEAFWLVGRAHSHGNMSRRELIRITLLLIEDAVKLAPKESQECITELWKWVNGCDSVDLEKVRDAANAANDAYTANAAYDDVAAASAVARAVYAAYANAANAAYAADYAADAVRVASDVAADAFLNIYKKIYSITTCEEVCKYFKDMDKEKVIA